MKKKSEEDTQHQQEVLRKAHADKEAAIHQLNELLKKMEEDRKAIGHLQGERALMEGMYLVGSPTIQIVEKFRDLRDNALTNLLFNLTDDSSLQDALLPQLSHILNNNY